MRKKRKTELPPCELNLTPMIDVTFLLLIFFLVGTKFKEPEGKLNAYLPKDKGPPPINQAQIDPVEELTIRVRKDTTDGHTYYQIGEVVMTTPADLDAQLLAFHANKSDQPVTIDPDPLASYEIVIGVLNSCVKIGYKEISFAAAIPSKPMDAGDTWEW